MSRERRNEIICVAALLLFIAFLFVQNSAGSKTAEQIFTPVCESFKSEGLKTADATKLKKEFSLSDATVENYVYYCSDSIMEVRELLLLELKDPAESQEIFDRIKTRVDDKAKVFEKYAPEQNALLQQHVLQKRDKFIVFAVCDNPDEIKAAFKKAF